MAMSYMLSCIQEPMREEELAFLKKKKDRQQSLFSRAVRTLVILCIVMPMLVGLIMESLQYPELQQHAAETEMIDVPRYYYLIGMAALLVLVGLGSYWSYVRTLRKLVLDLREQTKMVEKTEIVRKQFMTLTQTYHFYIQSAVRLSIEVNALDFEKYQVGDEINIEYSSHALEYFGYF
jgi:hypothetical protein